MSLIHPHSLERWEEWRTTRRRSAAVRNAAARAIRRPGAAEPNGPAFTLHTREGEGHARVLLGVDSGSMAMRDSVLSVLPYLHAAVDVLTPVGLELPELSGPEWSRRPVLEPRAALAGNGITAALTTGWERRVGHEVHDWARQADVPSAVVQLDPLTPFTAPLPPQTTLLAWNDRDAEFRRSGRQDVEVRTVGSQRLWQAGHEGPVQGVEQEERPVFLGQLSAIELPRRLTAGAAQSFCRSTGALYQPGPEDTDRLSRATQALLRRRGIEFHEPPRAIAEMRRPVVSVMSGDILEAAVRGLPAWAHCPNAPDWLHEYWERYGMSRAGGVPTSPLPIAADEPARLIAQILEGDT